MGFVANGSPNATKPKWDKIKSWKLIGLAYMGTMSKVRNQNINNNPFPPIT